MVCPRCEDMERQSRDGFTSSGSQRYRCNICGARYTPSPKPRGYCKEMRSLAVRMHLRGLSYREIGRHFQIDHVTVINWVKDYKARLYESHETKIVERIDVDEMYSEQIE